MTEPDEPQDALSRLKASTGPHRRGRLHLYLGMAPGVGKTYGMLMEGRRLRAEGRDVVVGFVETHGRAGTTNGVFVQTWGASGAIADSPFLIMVAC